MKHYSRIMEPKMNETRLILKQLKPEMNNSSRKLNHKWLAINLFPASIIPTIPKIPIIPVKIDLEIGGQNFIPASIIPIILNIPTIPVKIDLEISGHNLIPPSIIPIIPKIPSISVQTLLLFQSFHPWHCLLSNGLQ